MLLWERCVTDTCFQGWSWRNVVTLYPTVSHVCGGFNVESCPLVVTGPWGLQSAHRREVKGHMLGPCLSYLSTEPCDT